MSEQNKEREVLATAADAAAFIERKAEDYARDFGYSDMGSLSFGQGDHAQAKMDYYTSLTELADELRGLAAPAPVGEHAAQEGDCKCRRLGDWNGEHHPLCDAAQPAAPVQPDECAQDVYQHGVSIGLFDIPKATANAICAGITAVTGARVDWHYIAGRVHMKALAEPAPADRQGVALSEQERDGFVGELIECGTEFAAPLYAVVEKIERIILSRASSSRAEGEIPEGYVLVPKEPTAAINRAIAQAVEEGWLDSLIWRKALRAADAAPNTEEGERNAE